MNSINIEINRHAREVNNPFLHLLTYLARPFSGLRQFSLSKWLVNKLQNSLNELNLLLDEDLLEFQNLSKADGVQLFESCQKIIPSFIKFHESLLTIDFFNRPELKQALEDCMTKLYIVEAKSKKIAKQTQITPTERELKDSLAAHSKIALANKLSNT